MILSDTRVRCGVVNFSVLLEREKALGAHLVRTKISEPQNLSEGRDVTTNQEKVCTKGTPTVIRTNPQLLEITYQGLNESINMLRWLIWTRYHRHDDDVVQVVSDLAR
jgi:hypothetical protein